MEGEDVKRIREKLKMTQSEFARKIGTSRRNVENWEQGLRGIGKENAEKLERLDKE